MRRKDALALLVPARDRLAARWKESWVVVRSLTPNGLSELKWMLHRLFFRLVEMAVNPQ